MTINLQSIFISSLISEKNKWFLNKRKKVMFKTLAWAELAEGYLNSVTKHL